MMQLDVDLPRLLPSSEPPRYTFVPGSGSPHPIRDPRGHSHNRKQPPPAALDPENWAESRCYLWAIDLFNLGYYWEAHEEWERLLRATGIDSTTGRFLKGLIKLAAAGVKSREGRPRGVKQHAARAAELLKAAQSELGQEPFGLALAEVIAAAETMGEGSAFQGPRLTLATASPVARH
jgi:predicted metal-dependent hydrolase